jgi:hypothetical protein
MDGGEGESGVDGRRGRRERGRWTEGKERAGSMDGGEGESGVDGRRGRRERGRWAEGTEGLVYGHALRWSCLLPEYQGWDVCEQGWACLGKADSCSVEATGPPYLCRKPLAAGLLQHAVGDEGLAQGTQLPHQLARVLHAGRAGWAVTCTSPQELRLDAWIDNGDGPWGCTLLFCRRLLRVRFPVAASAGSMQAFMGSGHTHITPICVCRLP